MAQEYGILARGGADSWSVVLTDLAGWSAASEAAWVWKMLLGTRRDRSALSLALTAASQVRSTVTAANDTMTLIFNVTPVQSVLLPVGVYYVEIEGTEATGEEHYYSCAWGELTVREPEGGG